MPNPQPAQNYVESDNLPLLVYISAAFSPPINPSPYSYLFLCFWAVTPSHALASDRGTIPLRTLRPLVDVVHIGLEVTEL